MPDESATRDRMEEGKPTPDPTVLTTEQLLREIDRLEKLMTTTVTGLSTLVDEKMRGVSNLLDEKFVSVGTQFALIERQRVEQKKDTKDAVDAALAAAKEAVKEQTTASDRSITKSETATSEQLKQLNVTFTTAIAGISDVISDVKERVSRIESVRQGGQEQRTDARANVGVYIALGGTVLTVLIVVIMVMNFITSRTP